MIALMTGAGFAGSFSVRGYSHQRHFVGCANEVIITVILVTRHYKEHVIYSVTHGCYYHPVEEPASPRSLRMRSVSVVNEENSRSRLFNRDYCRQIKQSLYLLRFRFPQRNKSSLGRRGNVSRRRWWETNFLPASSRGICTLKKERITT